MVFNRSLENKINTGICWAKSLTGFKLDATYANIMQRVAFVCMGLKWLKVQK